MQFLMLGVLLLAGIPLVASIASQCYQCIEGNCGDPFNANGVGVTRVLSDNGWCLKIKAEQSGQAPVVRGVPKDGVCSSATCTKQTIGTILTTTCCCTSDLCNAAPRSVSTMTASFIICLVVLALFGTRLF